MRSKSLAGAFAPWLVVLSMGLPSLGAAAAEGEPAATAHAAPAAPAAPAHAAVRPADAAWHAALPRDPTQATQAYLERLPPAAQERSNAYFVGGYWLQLWNLLLGLAISLWLLQSRPAKAARAWCVGRSRRPALQALVYGLFFLGASWLISLPLTIYQGYFREHQYGMATQTFGPWFLEQLTSLGLSLLIGGPVIAAVYAVIRRAPQRWWVGATALGVLLIVLGALVSPVYIDPLFNTYKPLADTPIKRSIVAMARANGVPVTNVYEFDASRQTTRISANVSGLWNTASVRLNDNLLRRASEPEILAVLGHEIGHYAMNHVYKSILQFGLILLVGMAFSAWALRAALRRYGGRWGVTSPEQVGSLPLLAAALSLFLFVATPFTNTITRTMESEADLYGLNLAREPDGFAEAILKLVEYRKADPGPIEEWVFFDHPSARTRIGAAMRWKAEMQPATP